MRFYEFLAVMAVVSLLSFATPAAAETRALGLDISAWQGNISQATWNNLHNVDHRDFAFIRSSRGGTTGYYNQSDSDNSDGLNTLSQRYDDPYFVQNITRATNAGMFAGAYHFGRMDVIASTFNAGGIPNNGTDEANHFMQMASPWMRPGYLNPVFDFEAGDGLRTPTELAQFAIDFSNRIYEVMKIRPAVYIGGNYASPMNSIALAPTLVAAYPNLWTPRWPSSYNVQTDDPGDFTPTIYGPWDNPPNPADPWDFWQYTASGALSSYSGALDLDVAHGGIEFVKDNLVPAVWMNDASGDWSAVANWNSGQTPVAPVQGPGQVARVGTLTLPAVRLPGANDTVIVDRPAAGIDVTLAAGTHNIRKLYVRETLNITGGSLTVNYIPAADSTPIAAQFSAAVTLSGNANLSVHTLQVDTAQVFTVGGSGTLTFNKISLMPHAATPAKIVVNGDVHFTPLANAAALIVKGAGTGNSGLIDLGGGDRSFIIGDGSSATDLTVSVPIINGALTKAGTGTLALTGANTYAGDTSVEAGRLLIATAYLANAADLFLSTGATLELSFAGPDVIDSLFIDGVSQAAGTWGAVGSRAQFTSPLFAGTGLLQVTTFVIPPLSGDYNQDGIVDAGDYSIWRDSMGSDDSLPNDDTPGVGDDDYDRWRAHFGETSLGGSGSASGTALPEPASALLFAFAWGAFNCFCFPRRLR